MRTTTTTAAWKIRVNWTGTARVSRVVMRDWMINAPTYLGNSGGGVFLAGSRRLLGVFSKIYTHGTMRPDVIPHLGLCTPISSVVDWLEETDYRFVTEKPKQKNAVATAGK